VPLQITDWMPTFCALARHVPEKDLKWDGTNVLPVLTGSATRDSHLLYWTAPGFRARAIRDGDWKLIVQQRTGKESVELFNLASDPQEKSDLAGRMPDKVRDLQDKLARISQSDRDSVAKD
jgi:arylsulfatase A-like enzyme